MKITLARPLAILACGLFPVAAHCAQTGAEFSPLRTFALELLLLLPLAGLAYWLKFKRRKPALPLLDLDDTIAAGQLRPLGDGAYGQVIQCQGNQFLVVRSKTGAIHTTALSRPLTPSPAAPATGSENTPL